MAAKSTKGKKNTKSTAKKTQQKSGQSQNRDEIRGEIIILGLLAVCILLVLSNFGLGGIVGKTVSSVVFGIFGFMAYFLPFILFGAVAFLSYGWNKSSIIPHRIRNNAATAPNFM